jgi:hypothetical protein
VTTARPSGPSNEPSKLTSTRACPTACTAPTPAAWLHVDYEPGLTAFCEAAGFRPTAAGLLALTPAGTAAGDA